MSFTAAGAMPCQCFQRDGAAKMPQCYGLWFVAGAPVSTWEGARDLTAPGGLVRPAVARDVPALAMTELLGGAISVALEAEASDVRADREPVLHAPQREGDDVVGHCGRTHDTLGQAVAAEGLRCQPALAEHHGCPPTDAGLVTLGH